MNTIGSDCQTLIYKNVHNLYMKEVVDELSKFEGNYELLSLVISKNIKFSIHTEGRYGIMQRMYHRRIRHMHKHRILPLGRLSPDILRLVYYDMKPDSYLLTIYNDNMIHSFRHEISLNDFYCNDYAFLP